MNKIADISYGDFNDCALSAFAVYDASLKSISTVKDAQILGNDCLMFSTNDQVCSTFLESENDTVAVMQDNFGRKFIRPIDIDGVQHDIYLLNPSIKYGI
jgi:hypothetical protein